MKSAFPPCRDYAEWESLYKAAVLHNAKSIVPEKILEAETALVARGREVFYCGGTLEEKEVLEDALYALRAFRNSLEHAEAT